jgi:hypothetical protein
LLPRLIGQGNPALKPARLAEALMALAPSTILLLSAAGQSSMERLKKFIQRVPAYRLDVSRDLRAVSDVVHSFGSEKGA